MILWTSSVQQAATQTDRERTGKNPRSKKKPKPVLNNQTMKAREAEHKEICQREQAEEGFKNTRSWDTGETNQGDQSEIHIRSEQITK